MIRRAVTMVVLVALTGLLVFGAVHRTQSVLANQARESGTVLLEQTKSESGGLGSGKGLGWGPGAH
jgi:hypothetical protein